MSGVLDFADGVVYGAIEWGTQNIFDEYFGGRGQ